MFKDWENLNVMWYKNIALLITGSQTVYLTETFDTKKKFIPKWFLDLNSFIPKFLTLKDTSRVLIFQSFRSAQCLLSICSFLTAATTYCRFLCRNNLLCLFFSTWEVYPSILVNFVDLQHFVYSTKGYTLCTVLCWKILLYTKIVVFLLFECMRGRVSRQTRHTYTHTDLDKSMHTATHKQSQEHTQMQRGTDTESQSQQRAKKYWYAIKI